MKTMMMIAALTAAAAVAQPGPGNGFGGGTSTQATPSVTELKTYLGLSDAQVTGLQAVLKQAQAAIQNIQTQIQQKQSDLDALLAKGSTDAAALGKLLVDIGVLRKQLDTVLMPFRDQAKAVITSADQKAKLKTLDDASKLQSEIHEAVGLLLITPPTPAAGTGGGIGARGLGGPGMMGFRRRPLL